MERGFGEELSVECLLCREFCLSPPEGSWASPCPSCHANRLSRRPLGEFHRCVSTHGGLSKLPPTPPGETGYRKLERQSPQHALCRSWSWLAHTQDQMCAMDQMCARQEIQSFWVQHNTSLWESKGIPSARSWRWQLGLQGWREKSQWMCLRQENCWRDVLCDGHLLRVWKF